MFLTKKVGDFNKKESESLDFTGLKIPRDYMDTVEESKSFGAIVKRTGRSFADINDANGSGKVWSYKYKYLE